MKRTIISFVLIISLIFTLSLSAQAAGANNKESLTIFNVEDYISETAIDNFKEYYKETYGKEIEV